MGRFLLRVWRTARWPLSAVLAILVAFAFAPVALAHPTLLRSEPPDGAMLAEAPRQIRLWFSEPIAIDFTTIELIDGNGRRVPVVVGVYPVGPIQSELVTARRQLYVCYLSAASPTELVVDLPTLAPNVYQLTWQALSSNDLHRTSGAIVFGVQRAVDRTPARSVVPGPQPTEALLRWLDLGALAMLLGALALALLAWPVPIADRWPPGYAGVVGTPHDLQRTTYRRVLRLALWSGPLALVTGVGLLLVQAASAGAGQTIGANLWEIVSRTSYGARWLLRQGLLAALDLVVLLLNKTGQAPTRSTHPVSLPAHAGFPTSPAVPPLPPAVLPSSYVVPGLKGERGQYRAWRGSAAALAVGLVVVQALNGHATAFDDVAPVRVIAAALHLLAASVWSGGLLMLAVAVVPLLRRGAADAALAWTILQRFGTLAACSLTALLITGLFMSGQQVASLDALLTTWYGQALLVKMMLVAGVALIGLLNAAPLHARVAALLQRLLRHPAGWRRSTPRRLGSMVLIEASGGLVVLLLAAMLSATQPARGPEFDPPIGEATPSSLTTSVSDLVVTLSVKPNQPGQNFISLGVFNTRRPAPAPIERVVVRLLPPGGRPESALLLAAPVGTGRYQIASGAIDAAGTWQIGVTVTRAGLPDATAVVSWTVQPPPRPALISNRPLAPATTPAAVAIALLTCGATVGFRVRHQIALGLSRVRSSWIARRPHLMQKE